MNSHPSASLELIIEHNTPVAAIIPERIAAEQLHVIYAIVRGLNHQEVFNHPELADRWSAALVITTDEWAADQLRRQPMLKPKTSRLQFVSTPSNPGEICRRESRVAHREGLVVHDMETASRIIQAVSTYFSISIEDLETHTRPRRIAWARHCAMALVKKHTSLTLKKIGILFNRDHASIFYALGSHNAYVETDPKSAAEYAKLESLITAALGRPVPSFAA